MISRQRQYQIRMRENGCCQTCGRDTNGKPYCDEHLEYRRAYMHRYYHDNKGYFENWRDANK